MTQIRFKALSLVNIRAKPGFGLDNDPVGVIRQGETVLVEASSQTIHSLWRWWSLVDGRGWCADFRKGNNRLMEFDGVVLDDNTPALPFNVTLEQQYQSGEWSWESASIDGDGQWKVRFHAIREHGVLEIILVVNQDGQISVEQKEIST